MISLENQSQFLLVVLLFLQVHVVMMTMVMEVVLQECSIKGLTVVMNIVVKDVQTKHSRWKSFCS